MEERYIANILGLVTSHAGEYKLLDEWLSLINNTLPRSRRKTKRELAHLFGWMERRGYFQVEKEVNPLQYCFACA